LLFEKGQSAGGRLSTLNVQILSSIKSKSRTERQLARKIDIDILLLSPLITELMLLGYVETIKRRRLYFFSREYFSITQEGLAALEKARSPMQNIIELVRERALQTVENIASASPALKILLIFGKAVYKTVKS